MYSGTDNYRCRRTLNGQKDLNCIDREAGAKIALVSMAAQNCEPMADHAAPTAPQWGTSAKLSATLAIAPLNVLSEECAR
jgi:hypothetical protein